jgi:hypothetical protein
MHPRQLLLAASLVALPSTIALSAEARSAKADAEALVATIPLAVRVYDSTGLPASALDRALAVAAAPLDAADIETSWRRCHTGCDAPLLRDELVVRIVPGGTAIGTARLMTLGDAMIDRSSGSGRLATIYLDRVVQLAKAAAVDVTRLLGYAIAHELGHLLLGDISHSRTGLMRATWTDDDIRRWRSSDWRLTSKEVAAIRARWAR